MEQRLYFDVIFLLAGRVFDARYVNSLVSTFTYLQKQGISFTWQIAYNPIITDTRNLLFSSNFGVAETKSLLNGEKQYVSLFGGSVVCQKIIMIDDDMVWSVEDIIKLIESPYDVTTGVYLLSDGKTCSVAEKDEYDFMSPEQVKAKTEPFPIYAGGLGFIACTFAVINDIAPPWFGLILENKDNNTFFSKGEDFFFFEKLRNAKATIYADPTIQLGHIKSKETRF